MYEELVNALRWCADESICCDDFSGEKCPYFDEKKDSCSVDEILHAAADALEAADEKIADCVAAIDALDDSNDAYIKENERFKKRIARLEEDLKTREAEREVMQDTIKVCEKRIAELEAQMPKEGECDAANVNGDKSDEDKAVMDCSYCPSADGCLEAFSESTLCQNCCARRKD